MAECLFPLFFSKDDPVFDPATVTLANWCGIAAWECRCHYCGDCKGVCRIPTPLESESCQCQQWGRSKLWCTILRDLFTLHPIWSIYKPIWAPAVLSACPGDFSRGRARTCCQGAWSWSQWQCLDIKRFSPPTCSLHMQPSARIPVKGVGKTKADKVYLVLTAWGNQTIEWQEWGGAERGAKPKRTFGDFRGWLNWAIRGSVSNGPNHCGACRFSNAAVSTEAWCYLRSSVFCPSNFSRISSFPLILSLFWLNCFISFFLSPLPLIFSSCPLGYLMQ